MYGVKAVSSKLCYIYGDFKFVKTIYLLIYRIVNIFALQIAVLAGNNFLNIKHTRRVLLPMG
jgi:hypothetical protein